MPKFTALAQVAIAGVCALGFGFAIANEPNPDRARELVSFVRQDCGSCHGMTLAGGLGPPLLPKFLAEKPSASLVATVIQGRPGTAMPGWSGFMTPEEADWVVQKLKDGFPQIERKAP